MFDLTTIQVMNRLTREYSPRQSIDPGRVRAMGEKLLDLFWKDGEVPVEQEIADQLDFALVGPVTPSDLEQTWVDSPTCPGWWVNHFVDSEFCDHVDCYDVECVDNVLTIIYSGELCPVSDLKGKWLRLWTISKD